MEYTSAQAAKLLKKLNEELAALRAKENISCVFTASIDEDIESVRPRYNYAETQASIEEYEGKIRKVKHALNVFNTTTVIPEFGITIDEMLVLIPQLSERKRRLSNMSQRLPKQREAAFGNKAIVEYTYANYDISQVTQDLEKVTDTLSAAQTALDVVNNSITFQLDI